MALLFCYCVASFILHDKAQAWGNCGSSVIVLFCVANWGRVFTGLVTSLARNMDSAGANPLLGVDLILSKPSDEAIGTGQTGLLNGETPSEERRCADSLARRLPVPASAVVASRRALMIPGPMPEVRRKTPVPASPDPMVIAPAPASPDPQVSRCGTSRHHLDNRRRHGRRHNDQGWGHYHRSRGNDHRGGNGDSNADTDMNASAYGGDSQSCQGQDCDYLFHILYVLGRGRRGQPWLQIGSPFIGADEAVGVSAKPSCPHGHSAQ